MRAGFTNEFAFLTIILGAGFLFTAAPMVVAQSGPSATGGGNIGLPQSPGNIGKLKRGDDGKIIRTEPSEIQPDISSETGQRPTI
jgi:hypothetical protein